MTVQSNVLVSNSVFSTLESMAQISTHSSVTYLHALAQQICDTKDFFTLTARLVAAIPNFLSFTVHSGIKFVENTFTEDKIELSYTYFFDVLPWTFEVAACSIFCLSF